MAFESHALLTNVDPNSRFTTAGNGVSTTFTNLSRNESAYRYKDKGVGNIGLNFTHHFEIRISAAQAYSYVVGWMTANSVENLKALIDGARDGLSVAVYTGSTSVSSLSIREINGGVETVSSNYVISLNTTYYCTVQRDSSVGTYGTLYLRIYSDRLRTTLLTTLSVACTESQTFRYLYGLNSYNTAETYSVSGTVYYLNSNPSEAGVLGLNSYVNALCMPPQCGVVYDGKWVKAVFYGQDGSTAEYLQQVYGDIDTNVFGWFHTSPNSLSINRGYHATLFGPYRQSYNTVQSVTTDGGTNFRVNDFFKDNNSQNASVLMEYSADLIHSDYPCNLIDENDYAWFGGMLTSTTIGVRRATIPYSPSTWDSATTLHTFSGGNVGFAQLIAYSNGDIGALYADGPSSGASAATLYYKHWTKSTATWSAVDTIANAAMFYTPTFRGAVCLNDKLFVIYRDYSTSKLKYIIRSGGSWGSATDVSADILPGAAGTGGYLTACADVGRDESVYIVYHDGTNLVYRTWNGSVISGKTTLVSGSLHSSFITAPYFDSEKIPVVYHAPDHNIRCAVINLPTPVERGVDGTLVAQNGDGDQSTKLVTTQMVSYNNKSFVLYASRSQAGYGRVYNHTTSSWELSWTRMTAKYYADLHDSISCFIDDSGYIYTVEGGRDSYTSENVRIMKSAYPLDNASFALTGWSDVSPSGVKGRGYTWVIVDQAGAIYLIDISTADPIGGNVGPIRIREYRGGAWSSATELCKLSNAPDTIYMGHVVLGRESSGQKSLQLYWSIHPSTLPAVLEGNILQSEINYLKIVPQGNGTFKGYRADGVELTLPCSPTNKDLIYSGDSFSAWAGSTAYSVNDFRRATTPNGHCYRCKVAGTSGGSEPTWPTNHYATIVDGGATWEEWGLNSTELNRYGGGIDSIDVSTPVVVAARCLSSDPYTVTELSFYKWNGTTWIKIAVDNDSANYPWSFSAKIIKGDALYVSFQKDYMGQSEIVVGKSLDNGGTWSLTRKTNTSVETYNPILSARTASKQNLQWHERVHRAYSEVRFMDLTIGGLIPWHLFFNRVV